MEVDLCLCLCVSFSEATQSNEWKGYRASLREILDTYKVQVVVCECVGVCGCGCGCVCVWLCGCGCGVWVWVWCGTFHLTLSTNHVIYNTLSCCLRPPSSLAVPHSTPTVHLTLLLLHLPLYAAFPHWPSPLPPPHPRPPLTASSMTYSRARSMPTWTR